MAQNKYLNFEGLSKYDEKLKALIDVKDAEALQSAKDYADSLAGNYDAAGTAATKVKELAEGAVAANAEDIAKLNGDASTDGSVAKAIADAKALIDADIDAVEEKADAAQADADALEVDMGNVDNLSTTNKTVVGAINEVLAAVGTGGTAAVVTITTDTTTDGALKSYTIKQGNATVGVIDIPKDMVVESGEVVTNPEGQAEGTYIKLVLTNVAEPLYINVGTLVDIYKAQANATQVQVVIDPSTREISAVIVAGSITSTELADNAVITAKIADANVTKEKLSTAVQASLDKADASASKADFDEEVERAKAAEAQALTDAKAYADGVIATEKERAEGVEAGLDERIEALEEAVGSDGSVADLIATAKQEAIDAAAADATEKAGTAETNAKNYAKDYADGLNNAMNERVDALEDDTHTHANAEVLNGITAEKVAAWDTAEQNANGYADGVGADVLEDAKDYTDEEIAKIDLSGIGTNAAAIAALEEKVGDGFVAITEGEINSLFD